MPIQFCVLTGKQIFDGQAKFFPQTDGTFTYEYTLVGKVKIALPTYQVFMNNRDFKHFDLAGICRNAFLEGKEPPLIDTAFITGIKNLHLPNNIKEKATHLLKYMYNNGGKDYAGFNLTSSEDFTIAYATGEEEFNKIIKNLEDRSLIAIDANLGMSGHTVVYRDITLTDAGIAAIEQELPKIPMIGLVDQEITTGDGDTDKKINHAKKLFFSQPQTMDNMRSACETLSYVLEPLREDCTKILGRRDMAAFFTIVNDFDIRHNKDSTKQIQYPEQLEWTFYSLLNTINAYTKLKHRNPSM